MIFGIGTDIVAVKRMDDLHARYGGKLAERVLAPDEWGDYAEATNKEHFLAKRFAAKEALGKAFGTGIRTPLLLPDIAINHDELGKPAFGFGPTLAAHLAERGLTAHLSISDEQDYAVAFVILETR